ncbi:Protein kinase domain-containing protein [Amycolatopsis xylanica]|uniref:non-specific serine/threonine protein kinase n=2 Tax=Amycolatopsis xylanica TaxID=589385 RepID=A0A1H2ULV9_9PSEU|nr:Protein kinase domain-containing protein [Amycolatopsis xylanica]
MGMVWRGEDTSLDRVIAVKELILPFGHGGEEKAAEAKNRAMREARIAARLQHPHAITVFNVVEHEDRPWLIMEYLPSKSLSAVLAEDGPLPVDEVIRIGIQLTSALQAAHEAGIVHRDVKPGNVLIGEDGTVKVTDFGISRASGDATYTATGEISGTPAFLAPEVARGVDATAASDVFSLGATLYTAIEGAPPFGTADNQIALLYRVSSGEIVPPVKAGKLKPLLLRLLEVKPEDRPEMGDVLTELRMLAAFDGDEPPEVPAATVPATRRIEEGHMPAPVPPPVVEKRRRGALIAVAVGAVVVVIAVVAGILFALRQKDDTAGQQTPTPTPPPSSQVSSPAPEQPPVSSSETPPPTTTSPSTSPSAPAEQTPAQAIEDYFKLLPGNLEAGYATLSDAFKQKHSPTFQRYADFWNRFSAVSAAVTASGPNSASARLTYTEKGRTFTENHTYTLIQQNGKWLINAQT